MEQHKQHNIKKSLTNKESIEAIKFLQATENFSDLSSLAQAVCMQFSFLDPLGRPQTASCGNALRKLESKGHFKLPRGHSRGFPKKSYVFRGLGHPVQAPMNVPASVEQVQNLELVKVVTDEQQRTWNELMQSEHSLHSPRLVGCQMRYLLMSAHGCLGAMGYGASAVRLADRDKWIGWDEATRGKYLNRVTNMARFLIRPMVHCANLASRALSMANKAIEQDFLLRYGFKPWVVESFVDDEQYPGTSYKAANWLHVGTTVGRGRQDSKRQANKSIKSIYLHILEPEFRDLMEKPPAPTVTPREISQGLDSEQWSEQEFGLAQFGDARLTARLCDSARKMALQPGVAFTSLTQSDAASIKAYYRAIDRPDDDPQFTYEAILDAHTKRTIERMAAHDFVIIAMDGTELNFTSLKCCEGLGFLGTNQTGVPTLGLQLHTAFAITKDGVPLGLLNAYCYSPPSRKDDPRKPSEIRLEERESFDWIRSFFKCLNVAQLLPNTQMVVIGDRGADIYEFFDEQRRRGQVDLVVRAKHDRAIQMGSEHLFQHMRSIPAMAEISLTIERQSSRPKKSKQKEKSGHPERQAQMDMRWKMITFAPPRTHRGGAPIKLWAVHIIEPNPPEGTKRLEWLLLTTRSVTSAQQALEVLNWYKLRWRIEDWHRVLKSSCNVLELQHKTATRLKRAIAINLVISWRIMLLSLLSRDMPNLPASECFTELELEVLEDYAKKKCSLSPKHLGQP